MTTLWSSLIFRSFVIISKRMLHDHFHGGFKDLSEQMLQESKSARTTNVPPERDFGLLDFLMKFKPRPLPLVVEGIMRLKTNKTKD